MEQQLDLPIELALDDMQGMELHYTRAQWQSINAMADMMREKLKEMKLGQAMSTRANTQMMAEAF